MPKTFLQPSSIELDQNSLRENIRFLKKRAENGVKISSVIKGNAYGHGISSFLPMAEKCGISHFSVFSANEAHQALKHKQNPDTDIMIMGMIREGEEMEWAVENGIEFYLFEERRLYAAKRAAQKTGKKARVHIQVETGMNRTGFEESMWKGVFETVKEEREYLDLRGICTHYAGAESVANYYRVQNQDAMFKKAIARARKIFPDPPGFHASSSAAFLTFPEMQYDLVRIGIAQYGFWPGRETYMSHLKNHEYEEAKDPLRRVMKWKSEVMSTKWVGAGDFIGYGNFYMAGRNMRIATIPIGYTHGFGRNLTNAGYVLIRGERAGVVGLVNMNMITVDITDIPEASTGDEVVLIGKQGRDEITVSSFGEMTNNLNYEVLARLPDDIPRERIG